MPIDPRIPLGIRAPQVQDPFTALSNVVTTQKAVTDLRTAQQQQADQATIRQVLQETGGNMEIALPRLRQIAPTAALEFETEIAKRQKELAATEVSQLDLEDKRLTKGLRYLQSVKDDRTFQVARRVLRGIDPEVADLLGETYDPARVQQVIGLGLTAKDYLDQQQPSPAAAFTLGPGQVRYGAQGEVIATGPAAAPPANQGFTLSPGQVRYGPGGERLADVPAAPPALREDPLVPVVVDGRTIYRRRSQAEGMQAPGGAAGRPATEGERKAAGFHGQMQQALTTINQLESQLTERDLYQIQSLPQEGLMGAINRGAMSDAAKRYIQAFNQFTEARLRPVSGAAIAASEYERDRATYGKQYAETPTLAEQREAARAQALEALRVMGGSAIETPSPSGGSKKDPLGIR